MIIEKNDLKAFLRKAKIAYEIGAETVFCKDQLVKPGELHFCLGESDEALFRNVTDDHAQYNLYNVRAFYEAITLIDKRKVAPEEYIFKESGPGRELIDVGKFIQKKEVITQLHQSMKHGDWYYEYSDDFKVWRKGEAFFNGVKENLLWLSHQVNGKSLANELWTMYAPPHSIRRPDFLNETPQAATQGQQAPHDDPQVSQVKPAQDQWKRPKIVKPPGKHRGRRM